MSVDSVKAGGYEVWLVTESGQRVALFDVEDGGDKVSEQPALNASAWIQQGVL